MCEGNKKCKPCSLKELNYRNSQSIFDDNPVDTESVQKREKRLANLTYNKLINDLHDLGKEYFTPSQFEDWWNRTRINDDHKQYVYNQMSKDNLIHESFAAKILKENGIYGNELRANTLRQLILSVEQGYMNFEQINPTTIKVDGYTIEANSDGTFDVVNNAQVVGYNLTLNKVEEILDLREEDEDKVWATEMGLTEDAVPVDIKRPNSKYNDPYFVNLIYTATQKNPNISSSGLWKLVHNDFNKQEGPWYSNNSQEYMGDTRTFQALLHYMAQKGYLKKGTPQPGYKTAFVAGAKPNYTVNTSNNTGTLKEFSSTKDKQDEMRRYAQQVKDISVPRPRMAPRPKGESLPTKSYAVKQCGLYIQDEASSIIIDKYGFDKGYAAWENSISQGGAMYQIASNIANEKWVMCQDLKLTNKLVGDYFFRSYFDLWKQWSNYKTPSTSLTQKKLANASAPVGSQNNPMKKPAAPVSSKFDQLKKQIVPSSKDTMRVDDLLDKPNPIAQANKMAMVTGNLAKLIARGKEAEQKGRKDIAKIFYNKAKELLGETINKTSFTNKILFESLIKENQEDIETFSGLVNYFERGQLFLKSIPKSALSTDVADTILQIDALIDRLKLQVIQNTEMRDN